MQRLIIGSSIVYRTYEAEDFKEYEKYRMINCTSKEVFKAAMDGIEGGKGEVIVSVIENLLCAAVKDTTDPEAMNAALEKEIQDYIAVVKTTASKLPNFKFGMVQPTLRPLHRWYMDGHEAFCKKINEGARMTGLNNIGKIEGPIKMTQLFETDGVHLTATAGKVFVNTILYNSHDFFSAEVVDLVEEMEMDVVENGQTSKEMEKTETGYKKFDIVKRIVGIESEIANVKDDLHKRRFHDSMVTARIREELDFLSNMKKENRIIVTGLASRVPMPVGSEEKKKWLKDMVGGVLNQIEEGSADHITSVSQGWRGSHNIPLAEVKMDTAERAGEIRKKFATKKRAGKDFGRVYLANCVTLGTRVRVDILKAMSKCLSTERETMFVSAFSSRPLLHVRPKDDGKRSMAYTFADAITRFGAGLGKNDLGEAYRRAGNSFKGQLQQNFVVLYDSHSRSEGAPWSRGQDGAGGSRGPQMKRKLGEGKEGPPGTPDKRKKAEVVELRVGTV